MRTQTTMTTQEKANGRPPQLSEKEHIQQSTALELDALKNLSGPDLLKEFISTIFKDTEIGNFFEVLFGELETATHVEVDETVRQNIDKYKTMTGFELLCQEQARKGTLSLLFLQLPEGGFMNKSFSVGDTFTVNFLGNKNAEKDLSLSDLISDTDVSVISLVHNGTKQFGKRVFANGQPMYALCDDQGRITQPITKLSVFTGDHLQVVKREKMKKEDLDAEQKFKQEYINTRQYQEGAKMRRSSVEVTNHPPTGTENTKKSQNVWQQVFNYYKRGIPPKDPWIRQRLTASRWGTCCYNLANSISFAINGKGVPAGAAPIFDAYGKHGPQLDRSRYKMGTDVVKLINDKNLKPGTVFHLSTSGDYMSNRGSNHWFTFVERGPDGKCLFADQAGYAIPLSQICSPGRPLLAVYSA